MPKTPVTEVTPVPSPSAAFLSHLRQAGPSDPEHLGQRDALRVKLDEFCAECATIPGCDARWKEVAAGFTVHLKMPKLTRSPLDPTPSEISRWSVSSSVRRCISVAPSKVAVESRSAVWPTLSHR